MRTHQRTFSLALIVCVCLLANVSSAADFFTPAMFNVGSNPQAVASGDFNNDQLTDVVVANNGDNTISVLLGNSNGTFKSAVSYAVGTGPVSVGVADLNNDGRPDIIVANSLGTTQLSVLLGNGDGTFQPAHPIFYQGLKRAWLVIGDFNQDGNADVAVVNTTSATVSVLLGLGTGNFQTAASYTLTTRFKPTFMTAGDVNNDGKLDLVVTGLGFETVDVLLGNSDGTFQAATSQTLSFVPINSVLADVNRDGKLDVVTVGSNLAVNVLVGNGDGTFQTGGASFPVGTGPEGLALLDLNRDSKLDVVVTNAGGGTLSVLLGNGDGTFQNAVFYGDGVDPWGIVSGNFGAGHKLGVVATDPAEKAVSLVISNADGTLQAPRVTQGPTFKGVVAADVNGDGKLDVLETLGSLQVLNGNGDGSFQPAVLYPAGADPGAIAAGDLNGDGKADVVVTSSVVHQGSTVEVLLNNGDGTFGSSVSYNVADVPNAVALGDFNGDHKLDIAVTNLSNNTVSILLNNGDGSFQPAVTYPVAFLPLSLALADFNGDGKLDVAVQGSTRVTVLLGKGDGTLQAGKNYAAGKSMLSIRAADFNSDGKPDLVVANNTSPTATLSLLLNKGDGTFAAPVVIPSNPVPRYIEVGDFNGDGKQDIAVADSFVDILNGNGDGTFQPASTLNVCAGLVLISANFNADSRPDLLDACSTGPLITLPNAAGPH